MEARSPETRRKPKTLENDILKPFEQPDMSIRQFGYVGKEGEWKLTEGPNFRHTVPKSEGVA